MKQKLKEWYSNEDSSRAVSPVIGVILMVAITVILAAVIGSFVLGLGDSIDDTAPNAQISITNATVGGEVSFAHNGGDSFNDDNTEFIRVTSGGDLVEEFEPGDAKFGDAFQAGGEMTADETPGNIEEGDTVRVVWINGDSSNVLTTQSV